MGMYYSCDIVYGIQLDTEEHVTESIRTKYDEDTGEPYKIIDTDVTYTIDGVDKDELIEKLYEIEEESNVLRVFQLGDFGGTVFGWALESMDVNRPASIPTPSAIAEGHLKKTLKELGITIEPEVLVLYRVG